MKTTLLPLLASLLLPGAVFALDAETQRLERAALCQAMPYRPECGASPAPTAAGAGARLTPEQELALQQKAVPPESTPSGTRPLPVQRVPPELEQKITCGLYAEMARKFSWGVWNGLPRRVIVNLTIPSLMQYGSTTFRVNMAELLDATYTRTDVTPVQWEGLISQACLHGWDTLPIRLPITRWAQP
jgi:hypothetical protein